MNYIFIVNGRPDIAERINAALTEQLRDLTIPYRTYHTTGVGDGARYVKIYCDLHPKEEVCFVACGGSGTCNEVASGIVKEPNKRMAIFAAGTSNDFTKCFPDRDFHNIRKMLAGEEKIIDIMQVNDNYALNSCQMGFDSVVASEANYLSELGKNNPYRRGVIRAILTSRFNRIRVVADGKRIGHNWMSLCTLNNGQYVGGEFRCAPLSKCDDGLIDLCHIRPMSLLRFLFTMPKYRKGEHVHPDQSAIRKISYRQVRHVEVSSKKLISMCLDGELLPGTRFTVDILPQSVRLVLPAL